MKYYIWFVAIPLSMYGMNNLNQLVEVATKEIATQLPYYFCAAVRDQNLNEIRRLSDHEAFALSPHQKFYILHHLLNNYQTHIAQEVFERMNNIPIRKEPWGTSLVSYYRDYYDYLTRLSSEQRQKKLLQTLLTENNSFMIFFKVIAHKPFFEFEPLHPCYYRAVVDILVDKYKNFLGTFLINAFKTFGLDMGASYQGEQSIIEYIKNDAYNTCNSILADQL